MLPGRHPAGSQLLPMMDEEKHCHLAARVHPVRRADASPARAAPKPVGQRLGGESAVGARGRPLPIIGSQPPAAAPPLSMPPAGPRLRQGAGEPRPRSRGGPAPKSRGRKRKPAHHRRSSVSWRNACCCASDGAKGAMLLLSAAWRSSPRTGARHRGGPPRPPQANHPGAKGGRTRPAPHPRPPRLRGRGATAPPWPMGRAPRPPLGLPWVRPGGQNHRKAQIRRQREERTPATGS